MKMIRKRATHGLLRDPLGRAREAVRQRQPRGGIVVHSKFSLLIQNGILQRHFKVCRNWRPAFRSSPLGEAKRRDARQGQYQLLHTGFVSSAPNSPRGLTTRGASLLSMLHRTT